MELRDEQSLQVAKLYYRGGLSQSEVAAEMGLSRPTVAKLLQHAKTRGYVTVEIHDPREDGDELGQRLMERYGLEDVRLVFSPRGDEDTLTEGLGRVGAKMLHELVHDDGMSVGISWGEYHARSGAAYAAKKRGWSRDCTAQRRTFALYPRDE